MAFLITGWKIFVRNGHQASPLHIANHVYAHAVSRQVMSTRTKSKSGVVVKLNIKGWLWFIKMYN